MTSRERATGPAAPTIGVAIATRRASDDLLAAVASIASQEGVPHPIETLVVAERSEHGAIESLLARLGSARSKLSIRLLDVGAPGLSRARNVAARESASDVIAYVDDDAVATRAWLRSLAAVFREEPHAGAVGGPIRLLWGDAPRPSWWQDGLDEAFNALDFGPLRRRLRYPQILYGTNMAFRRRALLDAGLFREDLGRAPGEERLRAGEEAELQLRLEKRGHSVVFEPKGVVLHRVAAERLRPTYIRSRAFHHGRSHSILERDVADAGSRGAFRRAVRASGLLLAIPFSLRRHLVLEKDLLFEVGYLFERARTAFHIGGGTAAGGSGAAGGRGA